MKRSQKSRTPLLGAMILGMTVVAAGGGLAACGSSGGGPVVSDDTGADDASADSGEGTSADAGKPGDSSTSHEASTKDSGGDSTVPEGGEDGSSTSHEASAGDSSSEDSSSAAQDGASGEDAGTGNDAAAAAEDAGTGNDAAAAAEDAGTGNDAAAAAEDAGTGNDAAAAAEDAGTGNDAGTAASEAGGDDSGADATAPDATVGEDSGAEQDAGADAASAEDAGPDASPTYATCLQILTANPSSASGTYQVTVGSDTLTVYCDMSFDGGGWTLVESTNGGSCGPSSTTTGTVTLGSCASVATADVEALAALSTTVHIRSASGTAAPTQYITSVGSIPIINLRSGNILNAGVAVGCGGGSTPDYYRENCPIQAAAEEEPWVVVGDPGNANTEYGVPPAGQDWSATILDFGCAPPTSEVWPSVYHACDNGVDGFGLVDTVSTWNWSTQNPLTALEVYIR